MQNTVAAEEGCCHNHGCCGRDHGFLVMTINYRGHNFLVRTPDLVFLVLLERSSSVESINIKIYAIGGHLIDEKVETR